MKFLVKLLIVVQVLLIILKAADFIFWSWWLVMIPTLLGVLGLIGFFLMLIGVAIAIEVEGNKKLKK